MEAVAKHINSMFDDYKFTKIRSFIHIFNINFMWLSIVMLTTSVQKPDFR